MAGTPRLRFDRDGRIETIRQLFRGMLERERNRELRSTPHRGLHALPSTLLSGDTQRRRPQGSSRIAQGGEQ